MAVHKGDTRSLDYSSNTGKMDVHMFIRALWVWIPPAPIPTGDYLGFRV